jgi:hypothetical protein
VRFSAFVLLALLSAFSSSSFAAWIVQTSYTFGSANTPSNYQTNYDSCQTSLAAYLASPQAATKYFRCIVHPSSSSWMQLQSIGKTDPTACPGTQTFDQATGQCSSPPLQCAPPKTDVAGVCTCPAAGSGSSLVLMITGPNDPFPGQVNHGGCAYNLPSSGNPDLDGNGNNCVVDTGGMYNCYYNATPTGNESTPCETSPETCLPNTNVVPEEPTPTKPAETETQTQATPTGGTTTTTKEKTQQVAPDGMVEDKEITTITRTENGVTTTEVTTVTTVRQPDGSTTGTTQTTVTDGNGNTTIIASGSSSKPGTGTTSSEAIKEEQESEQVGGSYSDGTCTKDSVLPGSCDSSLDVVQCGIYQEQWRARCIAQLQNETVFGDLTQMQGADSVLGESELNNVVEEERNFSNAVSSVIDDGEFSFGAGCPAPHSFSFMGYSFDLSYQYVCDFASGIRTFVIALGYIFATIIVIRSLNQQV